MSIGAINCIDQMEAIVVISSQDSITIRRAGDAEAIKDTVILKHLAKFILDTLLHSYCCDWLLSVADIPHLDCEEITTDDVFSIFDEISRRIAGNHLSEKVFLATSYLGLKRHSSIISESR